MYLENQLGLLCQYWIGLKKQKNDPICKFLLKLIILPYHKLIDLLGI